MTGRIFVHETSERLTRDAFAAGALTVAPLLLGATLVRRTADGETAMRLTEVEAYMGGLDPGSHAFRGRTPRVAVLFGPPGHLYVYLTYGMHWCANVVCGPDGEASAVLPRAGEVVRGVEGARVARASARVDRDLARGPARLASALGLGRAHNGADLCLEDSEVWLEIAKDGAPGPNAVRRGPRVGPSGPAGDGAAFPWRFWIDG
jgi:DNA-3-methyladenine glycosylase